MENWFRTFHEGDIVVIEDESKCKALYESERGKHWVIYQVMETCCVLRGLNTINKGSFISLSVEKENLYKIGTIKKIGEF